MYIRSKFGIENDQFKVVVDNLVNGHIYKGLLTKISFPLEKCPFTQISVTSLNWSRFSAQNFLQIRQVRRPR